MRKILCIFLSAAVCASCGTIFSGSKAKVTLQNNEVVAPVDLTVDGKHIGQKYLPTKVKVKRGYKPSTIIARTEGYEDAVVTIDKKFNAVSVINLGNLLAWGIDAATGAITKPAEKNIIIPFKAVDNTAPTYIPSVPTEPTPAPKKEVVNRDTPGATSLERTIVRWYFESEPQGARIFWRVVSSVPDEVKNTNELWLGSTPFEETRSFNIQGLTYENANNVQIEIKVRRNGYLDQTKRFNVRQAIDQQEISSFFDMVKAE